MCTAIHLPTDRLFGRTLDCECDFGQKLIEMPRGYLTLGEAKNRYSVIGVGIVKDKIPYFFDGMNEWGLTVAALNFSPYAYYSDNEAVGTMLSPSNLVAFVLSFCKNTDEARSALTRVSLINEGSGGMPPVPLHWMIADARGSIVVEPLDDGLRITDNPIGVLTNAPPFDYHLTHLMDFSALTPSSPGHNHLVEQPMLYSRGMGALGLPGDFSSSSRFVRAAFIRKNITPHGNSRGLTVTDLYRILNSVAIPNGVSLSERDEPICTRYISCADTEGLVYYVASYACPVLHRAEFTMLSDSEDQIDPPMLKISDIPVDEAIPPI